MPKQNLGTNKNLNLNIFDKTIEPEQKLLIQHFVFEKGNE